MNFFKQILFLNHFTQFDENTQECFLDDPLAKLLKWFQLDLQMQFSNESSCMKPKGPELSFLVFNVIARSFTKLCLVV